MEVMEFKIKGRHSLELACLKVLPKKEPKAIVQIFHGMGEKKERYIPFMEFLADNGYAVYIHDHRKHGASVFNEGEHGMWVKEDTWHDVIDDAYFVSRRILKDLPGKEIYILGHSMGSIIARGFLGEYPLVAKKAILMGTLPPMSLTAAIAPILLARVLRLFSGAKRSTFLGNMTNKRLQPKYGMPRTEFDWLSRDNEIVDKYIEDPLCGYAYTPQFYFEFFKGIVACNKSNFISQTKHIPILFISGSEDPVGEKGEGVKLVHRQFNGHGYSQLTLKIVEEAKHEVLNETNKLETYQFILNWLDTSE
ncbi:lysophospholipase L2 [Candidatus Izimaplasma bacterium HR1]|jgi:alpha-beta hydrolase superfamily lysophospholipase|uniref:alpha/beta fold hydrolase n=1 Tax=Candidatus Izimoplasma sp. HR1 TaxID=1541959 RepID=UPI0004F833E5|nr:lysophospholipase L2 [Candidatus Izimaplasma bacterium HR1]